MDLTFANTDWLNPLWLQGTTALKYYCCSTQTDHSTFPMKSLFPDKLLRLTGANRFEYCVAKERKYNDSIERQGSDCDMRRRCSRGAQNAISAVSHKNCRRLMLKHSNTTKCEIWINQL